MRPAIRYQIGPGGLLYTVATGMILVGAFKTQANLLFWAFGLTAGALLLSIFLSLISLRKVGVKRLTPAQGIAGEPLVLRYSIENRGWIPAFSLLIGEREALPGWMERFRQLIGRADETPRRTAHTDVLNNEPLGWVMHVGPGQTAQGEALSWPKHRGELHLDRVFVSTTFPFGIVRKTLFFQQPETLLVYPRLQRINRRIMARAVAVEPTGRQQIDKPGGNEEFFGLRAYRSGDPTKHIDWKHSAKISKLITRELTLPNPPRVMVGLDLRNASLDAALAVHGDDDVTRRDLIESAIQLAASIVCDTHIHGSEVGMIVFGPTCKSFRMHHSLPHRNKILEALARLDVEKTQAEQQAAPFGVEPTVIVRPGSSVANGAVINGKIVLGTNDMNDLVRDLDQDVQAFLGRRSAPMARRDETAKSVAAASVLVEAEA